MAANTIGGVTVDYLYGSLDYPGVRSEVIRYPGEDHYRVRDIGEKAEVRQMRTIAYFNSAVLAEAAVATYKALQGTIVTVNDSWNNARSNCLIVDVQQAGAIRQVLLGSDTKYRLAANWQILPGSQS
jgi:hypothetical protein